MIFFLIPEYLKQQEVDFRKILMSHVSCQHSEMQNNYITRLLIIN